MGLRALTGLPGGFPGAGLSTASDPSSAPWPSILAASIDVWIDATAGNDGANGGRDTPWRTLDRLFVFIQQFTRVDSEIRANLVAGTYAFNGALLPQLGGAGKLVIRSDAVIHGATLTALAGSTDTVLACDGLPDGNCTGWTLAGLTGANAGMRAHAQQLSLASVGIAGSFANEIAEGDTFELQRPAAVVEWQQPGGNRLALFGTGAAHGSGLPSDTNPLSGIYLVNLAIDGLPLIAAVDVFAFGIEARAAIDLDAGATFVAGMPGSAMSWLDLADSEIWPAWGIAARVETQPDYPLVSVNHAVASGRFVGPAVAATGAQARLTIDYGALYGAQSIASVYAGERAAVFVGTSQEVISIPITTPSVNPSTFGGIVTAESGAAITLDAVALNGGANGATLLRARYGGVIQQIGVGPTGSTTGIAQDASEDGSLNWIAEPVITGAVSDLAADTTRAPNIVLANAPAIVSGPTGRSAIARAAGGVPQTRSDTTAWADVVAYVDVGAGDVELLPAPPSGYLYMIVFGAGAMVNVDSAAGQRYTYKSGGILLWDVSLTNGPATSTNTTFLPQGQLLAGNFTCAVTAASGTKALVQVGYQLVPAHRYRVSTIELTTAFQALNLSVPPNNVGLLYGVPQQSSNVAIASGKGLWVQNSDGVARTIEQRFTRGAIVQTFQSGGTLTLNTLTRSGLPHPFFMYRAGDLLEARVTALTTPGACTFGVCLELVPLLT